MRSARTIRRYRYGGRLLGEVSPSPSQISPRPVPGSFYQTKKGDEVWGIAKAAYKTPRPGIFWINDSPWNNYIRKGSAGWETYKVKGLQLEARYSPPTRAPAGSGKQFPLIWIPASAGDEPQEATAPPAVTPIPPGCPPPTVIEVPGPERIVEKRVEVPVPGPERIVEKRVEVPVPGPERIVEKRVEVPGPPQIIEKAAGPQWSPLLSSVFWGLVLSAVARLDK